MTAARESPTTAARENPTTAARNGPTAARRTGRRRWHRVVIPFGIVAALLTGTAIAYARQQPDPTDRAFLSPVSDEDIGADRLAGLVREAGVEVTRVTGTAEAFRAADGDATVFVPAPSLVHRDYLRALRALPSGTRVVLVEPRAATVRQGRLPIDTGARRLTAAAPRPGAGCRLEAALRAGPAAIARQRYGAVRPPSVELERCYAGGLVALSLGGVDLLLAGAVDPFRNDRIGERGNAALATRLLTARSRLVWLDLHEAEPPPPTGAIPWPQPDQPGQPDRPGGSGDGSDGSDGSGDGSGSGNGSGSGTGRDEAGGDPEQDRHPLLDAFPPWFWALLFQLAAAVVLFALWRARRLGPPVSEPLPVIVRAAETVRGRGRLYQRAKARGPALDILRAATRDRLAALLALPAADQSDDRADALVDAAAARTGRPAQEIRDLLYGPAPEDDEDLVRMAGELDALRHAARGEDPR